DEDDGVNALLECLRYGASNGSGHLRIRVSTVLRRLHHEGDFLGVVDQDPESRAPPSNQRGMALLGDRLEILWIEIRAADRQHFFGSTRDEELTCHHEAKIPRAEELPLLRHFGRHADLAGEVPARD